MAGSTVNRSDDPAAGDDFVTYDRADGSKTQGMHLDPEVQGELLSWYATGATGENQAVAKATPGRLFKADVLNATAGALYLMVFDKATAPVNTDVPVLRAYVPANGAGTIDLGEWGILLAAGVAVALSSTIGDLTLAGANDGFFQAAYL